MSCECPYCEKEIEEPHPDCWEYGTNFLYDCEYCNKTFDVLVEFEPVFWTSKVKDVV